MARISQSTAPERPPAARQDRVTIRRETITPEIATAWLERNLSNRNLVQSTVDRYARDMRAGRWHYTGDPIQFGISGRLLNGQHRLWACVEAEVAFECAIVRGIVNEEEVVDVLDTGVKRTLASALQIHGEKDTLVLASIINTCWRYDLDRCTDSEAAEEFWRLACSGEGLTGDPILAYRRWIMGSISKRDKPTPAVWLAYTLKAMNLWRAGKNIRVLVVKPDEGMPEVWS
jgi:hypothetical protein